MWRRAVTILAVLAGLSAGAAVALKSRRVAESVKEYIARLGRERFGVAIAVGDLEVELLPPGVAVRDVVVSRPDQSAPWLRLHSGRIQLRPWPSTTGALVLHRVELDGLQAELDLRGADLFAGSKSTDGPDLDIQELAVWNASATVQTDEGQLELHRTDVQLSTGAVDGELLLSVGDAALTRDGERLPFEAKLSGRLLGTTDRPEKLEVERALLDLPEIALLASGSVDLQQGAALELAVEGRAALARLATMIPEAPALKGDAQWKVQLSGPVNDLRTHGRLQITGLSVEGAALGDIDLEATHNGTRLRIEALQVAERSIGTITGSGTVELVKRLPAAFSLRLRRASLAHILDRAGLPDAWVRLIFSGDVEATGYLWPLRLQLDVNGATERFAVYDRSYRVPEAVEYFGLLPCDIQALVTVTSRAVLLDEVEIKRGTSLVRVEGSLSFDPSVGMDMRASSEAMDLSEIGPLVFGMYEGRGTVAASFEGPYEDSTISGTLDVEGFSAYGFPVGDAKATIIFRDLLLRFDRVAVRRGEGSASGYGTFNFEGDVPLLSATFALSQVAAADLLESVHVQRELAERFAARLDGSVSLQGPMPLPNGRVNLQGRTLAIDGIPVGRFELRGGFGDHQELIWGEAAVFPAKGQLRGRVAWSAAGELTVSGDGNEMPLLLVRPFLGDVPLTGVITAMADLRGPPDKLSGRIEARLEDLVAFGIRLEESRVKAELAGGTMSVRGSALGGDLRAEGTVSLLGRYPFRADATLHDVRAARLYSLPDTLQATLSGKLTAQGDLLAPESVTADLRLDTASFEWRKVALASVRPLHLEYGQRVVRLDRAELSNDSLSLDLSGSASTAGSLDLQLDARGQLRALKPLLEGIEVAGGSFTVRTRVSGSVAAPELVGDIEVSNGGARLWASGPLIDSFDARLSLDGSGVSIDSANARVGGGTLCLGGRILLADGRTPELNVHADLASVSLSPAAETQAVFGGQLALLGPLDDPLLKGRIKLDSLRYSPNIDLDRLMARHEMPPLRAPAAEPDRAMRLAVSVQAQDNVILSSNVLEAEFRADLMVTGTTDRMGLVGSLTPLWAEARYRDNVFKLARGSIDFTEEYRVLMHLDLRATTAACGMKIAVDVQGSSDSYSVIPSGQDDGGIVDPKDVLSCLQFGLRLKEFEERWRVENEKPVEGASPLNNVVLAGGLDVLWTVSGVDRQVRKLLPFKLDEMRLESGWSSYFGRPTTRVLVGKELGPKLHLRYWRALDEDDQNLSVQYQLSEAAAVQGTWQSASDVAVGDFGLDLRLRWELQ